MADSFLHISLKLILFHINYHTNLTSKKLNKYDGNAKTIFRLVYFRTLVEFLKLYSILQRKMNNKNYIIDENTNVSVKGKRKKSL